MKKTKRLLSFILTICLIFSITTGLEFSAYAAENANAKAVVDSICATTGYRPGVDNYNDCYAYASAFCNKMYGTAPGGTSGYTLTRPGSFYLVGQTFGTDVSASSLSNLLSQAMPGDVVQMKWYTNANLTSSSQHTAIIYSANSTSFTILQDGASWTTIQKSTYSYSNYFTRWKGNGFGISLYRYNNYNSRFGGSSGGSTNNAEAPAKPTISKISNISNSQGKVKFEWNNASKATCYNLFIYSVNDVSYPVQSHWAIRNTNFTAILPNGRYVARVCSENETSSGNYYADGDLSSAFEVNSLIPDKPAFPSVTNNGDGTSTIKWDKVVNATCYNLFIYSANNTTNPIQSHWAIRNTEIKVTLPNGYYVMRLCSENETSSGNYYTDGDLTNVFEIDSLSPKKASIKSIDVTHSEKSVRFSWNNTNNTTCYNLFIYKASDTNNPIQSHWAIRNTEFTTTLPNGTYVARLCSENETSFGNYYTDGDLSSVFEVNDKIPNKPNNPTITVKHSSRAVTYKWNKISNATCYNLFIYKESDTQNVYKSYWAIRDTTYSDTLPNGRYVARLCSENETSNGNYYTDGDLTAVFEVNNNIPDKPANPTISINQNNGTVTYKWNKISNATCYNLFIYKENDTQNVYKSYWAIRDTTYSDTLPNGRYIARLCSENETSSGNYYTDGDLSNAFTVSINPHSHMYVTVEEIKATCTTDGKITIKCSCGATTTTTINAFNHSLQTTTTKATTSKNGSIVTTCLNDGCTYKKTTTIYYPKTITLSATKYTYDGKAKKPTVKVVDANGKTVDASNYTVTYSSGLKNVGKYTVKITFKGNYSGSVSKTFVINPKNTSISKLTATKGGFKATIKKYTTQTTGYQIRYSTKSNMSGANTVTIAKNTTTSKSVTGLSKGKKYYVQIRTFETVKGTKYYSAWSDSKTVTTKK